MKMLNGFVAGLMALLVVGCGNSAFDYEAATPEERQVWLASYADGLHDGLRDGLRYTDALQYFYVPKPVINTRARRIELVARFKSPDAGIKGSSSTVRNKLVEALCPIYLKGALDENKATVRVKIARSSGVAIVGVDLNASTCPSTTNS